MQCRLPRKNVPNKPKLTWYFHETVSWTADVTYKVTFKCNGQFYDGIRLTYTTERKRPSYLKYRKTHMTEPVYTNAGSMMIYPETPFKWDKEVYRTITFDVPPTGDLLTWLTANATPQ